jgi:hypothetical protein
MEVFILVNPFWDGIDSVWSTKELAEKRKIIADGLYEKENKFLLGSSSHEIIEMELDTVS